MTTAKAEMSLSRHFDTSSLSIDRQPPVYDGGDDDIALGTLTRTTSSSSAPPKYESVVEAESPSAGPVPSDPSFYGTHLFQINAAGHPLVALPLNTKPNPVPVFAVLPTGETSGLAYESRRTLYDSNNSVLVRAGDEKPVCSTTYRFGPGRPPRIQLHAAADGWHEEVLEVNSKGMTTRAQNIRTHLGTFQWRYAGRSERAAAGADNLLVLDRLHSVALAGGKMEERRRKVAQLVRSDGLRTEGSKRSTAGNGGRLIMDLREWAGTKCDAAQMEALVVASCLVMLKKEVDRRRMHQTLVMVAVAS